MRVHGIKRLLVWGVLAAAGAGTTGTARAQADVTAERPADLLVFGGYGYTRPDFGPHHNNGVTLGADYNRFFGWRVIPGLEFRANLNSGPVISEHTYLAGFRAHVNLKHRYRPYVDVLAGLGQANYPEFTATTHDRGFVDGIGGGVDIDMARNLMFKADWQYQMWNLGLNAFTKPQGGDFTLSPQAVTIGVTYRIPFRRWTDQAHNPSY